MENWSYSEMLSCLIIYQPDFHIFWFFEHLFFEQKVFLNKLRITKKIQLYILFCVVDTVFSVQLSWNDPYNIHMENRSVQLKLFIILIYVVAMLT